VRRLAAALAALCLGAGAAAGYVVTRPNPLTQAQADGCPRDLASIFKREAPTWVYVGDKDAPADGPAPPARWAHGIAIGGGDQAYLGSYPTGVDDPVSHDSYDWIVNVKPDAADADLVGTGNDVKGSDPDEVSRLHSERESLGVPKFALPEPGDRVALYGSWVWDCGHFGEGGERTELHPFRAVWVQRRFSPSSPTGEREADLWISTEATPAGLSAECAHSTKGDHVAFKACLVTQPHWLDVSGDYAFKLPAPPRPKGAGRLQARVVDHGGGPAPTVTIDGNAATVTLNVSVAPGQKLVVAKQVFLGWTNVPRAALPEHLRVRLKSLLVRRAMDPDTPLETTRRGQVTRGPTGEWIVYWDVAGLWGRWPGVLSVRDGQVVRGAQTIDVYVPRHTPWRVFASTRECDFGSLSFSDQSKAPWPCPTQNEFGSAGGDDVPGRVLDQFASPEAGLGLHRAIPLKSGTTCPPANPKGCYELDYVVTRVG
jgi:hypothetical protein